jgi:hypothetical protein
MRLLTTLLAVLFLSAFALGQVAIVGGTATSAPTNYDVYAAPFVPRIVTPSVSLNTVSPSPVGATNATFGNVAGATNSTLSQVNTGAPSVYTQPVIYPSAAATPVLYVQSSGTPMQSMMAPRATGYVGASYEDVSVKQMMADSGAGKKASRTYTNQDIDRVNQATGTVKYNGKTEQIK